MGRTTRTKVYKMCEHCGQLYSKICFNTHKCKQKKSTEEHVGDESEPKVYKLCQNCGEQSYSKSAFYRHKCDMPKKRANYKCDCGLASNYFKSFVRHMKDVHSKDVYKEEVYEFQSYLEFTTWLTQFQADTKSEFFERKKTKSGGKETKYFYCTRSGTYKEKQNRSRAPKKVGSKKIGRTCTARLKVEITKGSVKAIVNAIHYGHENDLQHVHLDQQTKNELAQNLCDGIPSSRILKNIFTESTSTDLKRKHLVTKRDIDNIKLVIKRKGLNTDNNTKENRKKSTNTITVKNLIEENKESILFYKELEILSLFHPSCMESNLEKEDFALGIMSPFQKGVLEKYGHNTICTDVKHGTIGFSFLLVSLLVIDECGESIPVAWLFCNKIKEAILELFFKFIKISVGTLTPKLFMSDKDPECFRSWQEVFPGDTQQLLCHQNVCNYWKKKFDELSDKDAANKLSEFFSLMLNERDENMFHIFLESFLNEIFSNEVTKHLGHYFVSEWVPIAHQWANCFRFGIEMNSIKCDEAFSKKIETLFNGKKGTRVEKFLIILLDYVSEMARKKLIKNDMETSNDIMEVETSRDSGDTCTVYNFKDSLVKRMKKSYEALETVDDFSKLKKVEEILCSLEEVFEESNSKPNSPKREHISLLSEDGNYFTYEVVVSDSIDLSSSIIKVDHL